MPSRLSSKPASKDADEIGIRTMKETADAVYVGIDLSYSSTGLVLIHAADQQIEAHTCKAGLPKQDFAVRAKSLWLQIQKLLPEPDAAKIAMEGAAYAAEFNAFMLGELSGALKVYLSEAGYDVTLVPPTTLKKYATGKGNATKEFVGALVAVKWGFTNPSNDIVDAFVLAKYMEALDTTGEPMVQNSSRVKHKPKLDLKGENTHV